MKKIAADLFEYSVVILVGIMLVLPVILYGFPAGHDGIVHVARYTNFAEQLWSGELYPRWLIGMNGGLGSPIFFFYGPLPYYMASLFHLVPHQQHGWFQLGLSCALATVAAGSAAYVWLRHITGRTPALIAALLYMAMPYALAVDLYRRAALGEYWTFVWMPLILHFTRRLAGGRKTAFIGLTIAYALLVLTHLPITLMFSGVPIAYALFLAKRDYILRASIQTAAALVLGLSLAAIYWVPAMTTQRYIAFDELEFYSDKYLLFTGSYLALMNPKFSDLVTFLSQVALVTIGVAYCCFILTRNGSHEDIHKESVFWFVIAMVSLGMMAPLGKPIWAMLTILQTVQFPWRFMAIMTVATAALIALGVASLQERLNVVAQLHLAMACLLIIGWVFPTISIVKLRFWSQRPTDQNEPRIELSLENPGFRPRWVPRDMFNPQVIRTLGQNPAKTTMLTGHGTLTTEQWKAREIILRTNTAEGVWLAINQFYYPGWSAHVAGESRKLPLRPSEDVGLLNIWVPAGTRKVLVQLDRGSAERIGYAVSALAFVTTVFLVLAFQVSQFRREQRARSG